MRTKLFAFSVFASGVGASAISCDRMSHSSDSDTKYMDQALRIGGANIKADDKEVVVYYANETDHTEQDLVNFDKIVGALKGDKRTEHIGLQMESDKVKFGNLVDGEVAVLSSHLCSPKNKSGVGLIVFDNRYTKQGRYRHCEAGQALTPVDSPDFRALQNSAQGDFITASHPLMTNAGLNWALKQVSREFPDKSTLITLILRSHGFDQGQLLLGPRVALKYDKMNGDEKSRALEIQRFAANVGSNHRGELAKKCGDSRSFDKSITMDKQPEYMDKQPEYMDKQPEYMDKQPEYMDKQPEFLDKLGFDKLGFDKFGFNKEAFDKTGFAKEGFATIGDLMKNVPGLTKAEFLKILAHSGHRYGVVATLSCHSSWSQDVSKAGRLPVEWIVGADEVDRGIPYEALQFDAFMTQYGNQSGTKLTVAFKDFLEKASLDQKARHQASLNQLCQSRKR
jgi:hypothetical protein